MNKHNILSKTKNSSWFIGLLILIFFTFPGCTWNIYDSMHVTKGDAPALQDKDVLFRNIYYFRVFEYCLIDKESDSIKSMTFAPPVTRGRKKVFTKDNLFRFRMTGKGRPLFLNKVRFEAGTLHKSEIDPFGNPITVNKKTGGFRYTSKQEIELEKKNFKIELFDEEYKHLLKLKSNLENHSPSLKEPALFKKYIEARIENLTQTVKNQPTLTDSPSGFVAACNNSTKQEFWILGPEGWRRFNPDDRLVLAMSTSGKPIIGPMKEIAGRILNEQVSGESEKQIYDGEQGRIKDAENYLLKQESAENPDKQEQIINTVIEKLGESSEGIN